MKLYLSSARIEEIRWAADADLIDGVLTTPGILTAAGAPGDERDLLTEICQTTGLPVLASVGSVSAADVYREGRDLAKLSDQIVVQIPLVEDALTAIGRLRADGVRVVTTLVYGIPQAILGAKAGAYAVSVSVEHLDLYGHDGADIVRDIVTYFAASNTECDVLAAMPQHPPQFARCARAGADILALAPAVLHALFVHPLTDRGLDQWLQEVSSSHRPRVAE